MSKHTTKATLQINTKGKDDLITSVTINNKRIPAKAVAELASFLQRHILGN